MFFRALAIIEKSKSTSISVFISEFGAASKKLMLPGRLLKSLWGLCGSGLSWSCQGDLGRDSVKIDDEESEGTRDRGCGSARHRPRAMSGATASRIQQSGDGQEQGWAGLSELDVGRRWL